VSTATEIPPFLHIAVARLGRALAPERIVLFGSYAKGTPRAGSDLDLLIVCAVASEPWAARRARQLVAPGFPPVDTVLCTPEEAERAAEQRSPFLHSILENGVTVFRSHGAWTADFLS
jgi:UTP:GlnB (protein PII) uridylyltransferase